MLTLAGQMGHVPVSLKLSMKLIDDSPWQAPTLITCIKLAPLNLEVLGTVGSVSRSSVQAFAFFLRRGLFRAP